MTKCIAELAARHSGESASELFERFKRQHGVG